MMPTVLYLLKANLVLLLFAAAYFGLLRRLTFFTLNRAYLVFALLFAAVYPALPVPALLPAEAAQPVAYLITEASGAGPAVAAGPAAPVVDWVALGLAVYAAGVMVLLGRLLVQLLSLWRLRRQSRPALVQGLPVRVLAGAVSPFSFGQTIYLNPEQHPAPELAAVLRHEQVHVRQWHTLDVLLAQLALAAAWCNPAAWLLRRALLDNLEYLADHAVLETGLDRRAYQYSLLRLSHAAAGPALVSHFTFPTLKNRVAMMNTPFSSTGQLARYFVAGPLVLAMALGFSAARAQDAKPMTVVKTPSLAAPAANGPKLVYVDGQLSDKSMAEINPQNIARIDVFRGDRAQQLFGNAAGKGVLVVTTKANQNRADVQAFNQRIAAVVAETQTKNAPAAKPRPITVQVRKDAQMVATAPAKPNAGTKVMLRNPAIPAPAYYVDGQLRTTGLTDIDPKAIASVNVVKGDQARQRFGESGANGAILITTKANQDRADVVAFNEKSGPAVAAQPVEATPAQQKPVPYLAAPALAYITKNYPDARLVEMTVVPAADGGASNYKALLAIGRRPVSLLFDERGQFISEVPSNR